MTLEAAARASRLEVAAAPAPALDLSPPAWKAAFPALRVRELDDGAPVYRQGEAVDAVFVLESGYVRLCAPGLRGREVTTGLRSARDAFGPGLPGARRAAESAYAKGPVRVYRVPGAEFRRALVLGSPFARQALRVARAREHMLARRLASLTPLPAPRRVAATLAELLVHHGAACHHGEAIHLPLDARELADLAGAIHPQVRMTLGALRRRGYLRGAHDFLCVRKLDVLLRLLRRRRAARSARPTGR